MRFLANIWLTTFCIFFGSYSLYAEGSKQTRNDSLSCSFLFVTKSPLVYYDIFGTYDADSNHNIHVAIKHPGENLYMGFNWTYWPGDYINCRIKHNGIIVWGEQSIPYTNGQPGRIDNHAQAVIGPNILNPAGYIPFVFRPSEPGDYIVEFDFPGSVGRRDFGEFDFTVIDTTISPLKPIDGRTWSKNWIFQSCTSDSIPLCGLSTTFFVQTQDSIIDSVEFSHLGAWYYTEINFNRNGCLQSPVPFELSRRSRIDNYNYPEFKVFFNNPDSTVFPPGIPGAIIPGSLTMTPDCNGQYYISFSTNKPGRVQVSIEVNSSPGIQPEDIILTDSVGAGTYTIVWDGYNGLGVKVPETSTVNVIITFMNGLMNMPLVYVPANWFGFKVGSVRPLMNPPLQFWNDTLLPTGQIQKDGCLGTLTTGCHDWPGTQYPVGGFGQYRTINTWWFSADPDTLHNVSLSVLVTPPDSIHGPQATCYAPGQLYSYTIYPNPLAGASHYHWQLYNGMTLVDSWQTQLPVNDSVSFPGTGYYSLIAKGENNCTTGVTDTIFIQVSTPLNAGVTISPSANNVCAGTQVTFTATPANPGTTPFYQWKVNGLNVGMNSPTFNYAPLTGDLVKCVMTSSITNCVTNNPATSNTITMIVNPNLPVGVTVSPSANNICAGTMVTFTANPTYPGTTPTYQWKVNGLIVGTNSPTYSYVPLNNDVVTCTLTSSETCTQGNPATSNPVTMTVNSLVNVTVNISASSNPFCIGSSVTFTAAAANPGTSPVYLWKVNGINAGTNSPTFTYNPVSGDVVSCVLTSSVACPLVNPVTSNTITLTGNTGLPAGVSIAANPNPFCPGTSVTFTATPTNGGTNPSYQWKVNGTNAGTNSPTFSYNAANNDSVRCMMTSNLACVSGNPATSNKIILSGTLAPIVTFTTCFDTVTTLNAKPIKLKGGIPLNGTYSGPGVTSNTFIPAIAGMGTKTITYTYTNAALCSASKTKTITVQANPAFTCGNNLTDIRDGKSYPTVQIGSQCWMASNLNYGTMILSSSHQRDNCVNEKYCYNDLSANCGNQTYYQWDELMRYDVTPAQQGLCPPGWHVPTEAEWNTLFSNWSGNGFAGSPLKYSGFSGFNALLSGVKHQNVQWNFLNFATFFWTSTANGPYKAWSHGMNDYNPSVSLYPSLRSNAFSIRCLRD